MCGMPAPNRSVSKALMCLRQISGEELDAMATTKCDGGHSCFPSGTFTGITDTHNGKEKAQPWYVIDITPDE